MRAKRLLTRYAYTLSSGLLGLLVEIEIVLVSHGPQSDLWTQLMKRDTYSHILATVTIALAFGFILDIGKEMDRLLKESSNRLHDLRDALDLQEQALKALLDSGNYYSLMRDLFHESINVNFNRIPAVHPNRYLDFLQRAIELSRSYQGVQRKPISWFRKNDSGGVYLQKLRDKKMQTKTRVFIIDESDVSQMQRDLDDKGTLSWYWDHTGDVRSFWISANDFRDQYGDAPEDFALYDGKLLVKYDEARRTLSFNLVNRSVGEVDVFDALSEQLRNQSPKPFSEIKHTKNRGDREGSGLYDRFTRAWQRQEGKSEVMARNRMLSRVLKGRVVTGAQSEGNTLTIRFDNGSMMTVQTGRSPADLDARGRVKAARQQGTTLALDFEDGGTWEIQKAGPTSSLTVRDRNGVVECAD